MRLLALLLVILPGIALAQTTQATFDIYVGGVRAGVISIAGEERDGRYSVAGQLDSVGIIAAFKRVNYDADVRGRTSGAGLLPERYVETRRNGSKEESRTIAYTGGVPSVTDDDGDLDPAAQGGTVDPLTAIWGVLRDVPEAQVCRFAASIFDGERRSRVALTAPRREGERIACRGEYRRVAGYSDSDMKDPGFPFEISYRPQAAGRWEVARIDMKTILGRGAMVRR